jgi:hypothetical protein
VEDLVGDPKNVRSKAMSLLEELEGSYSMLSTANSAESSHRADSTLQLKPSSKHAVHTRGSDGLAAHEARSPQAQLHDPSGGANSFSEALQQFDSNSSTGDTDEKHRASHSLAAAQLDDIAALGVLIVQLYTGRMHHVSLQNLRYWQSQVRRLPSAAQGLARACLRTDPSSRPAAEKLLRDLFFMPALCMASSFMSVALSYGAWHWHSCSPSEESKRFKGANGLSSSSDGRASQRAPHSTALGALQEIVESAWVQKLSRTPGALDICLPAIVQVLRSAAAVAWPYQGKHSGPVAASESSKGRLELGHFSTILRKLLEAVPRQQLHRHVLPLWTDLVRGTVSGQHSNQHDRGSSCAVVPDVQTLVLQPELLRKLKLSVQLSAFLNSVHACILDIICCSSTHSQQSTRTVEAAIQVGSLHWSSLLGMRALS